VSESILVGYAEVSELTGIPVYTLKDYRAKGDKGPRSAVIAGKVKYKRADVLAWIDEQFENSGKGGSAKPTPRFAPLGNRSLVNA
jgi:predicted DNA-binding transcriptional regulator AlpA